jgi:hypothetical protein
MITELDIDSWNAYIDARRRKATEEHQHLAIIGLYEGNRRMEEMGNGMVQENER